MKGCLKASDYLVRGGTDIEGISKAGSRRKKVDVGE